MHSANPSIPKAICICGTYFRRNGRPTPLMQARLTHGLDILRGFNARPYVVASGGTRGTALCPAGVTEAHLIQGWFRHRGVHSVFRDDFSNETIGNLVFVYCGFLEPLRLDRAVFITDGTHAPRVQRLADHILGGLVDVSVSGTSLPFDVREARIQRQLEAAGAGFVDTFLSDVPRGDPDAAFAWVAEHHRAKPYAGLRFDEVKKQLREQLYCSNALCAV